MIKMALYLIRHALPSPAQYDNRPPGPGLGKVGQLQAEWLAKQLGNEGIRRIYASDFLRTVETAKIIVEATKIPEIQFDVRLRERQAEEESHESLVARVGAWWADEYPEIRQEVTGVVAHGGSLNMVLELLDRGYAGFYYPYCDSYEVRTPIAGYWKIAFNPIEAQLYTCPIALP